MTVVHFLVHLLVLLWPLWLALTIICGIITFITLQVMLPVAEEGLTTQYGTETWIVPDTAVLVTLLFGCLTLVSLGVMAFQYFSK